MSSLRTLVVSSVLVALTGVMAPVAVSAPASAAAPRLVVYDAKDVNGIQVSRPAQAARRLHAAPRGFQRFVARTLRHMLRHSGGCPPRSTAVFVSRVRSDGYARGAISQCGGYIAIWKRTSTGWRQVIGTQDIWTCRELRRYRIPGQVVRPDNRCYNGTKVVRYHHR